MNVYPEQEQIIVQGGQNVELDQDYGNCKDPGAMYVKLVFSDNHEFITKRDYVKGICQDYTRGMLNDPVKFSENEINEICFRNISSFISQKPLYKAKYSSNPLENFKMPDFKKPNFDIELEIAMDQLMTTNFLDN